MGRVKQVIYEDGSIAYIEETHHISSSISMTAKDGGKIPVVSERDMGELNPKQRDAVIQQSREQKGEFRRGQWQTRQKSLNELVEQGVLTPEQAERRARKQQR